MWDLFACGARDVYAEKKEDEEETDNRDIFHLWFPLF